MRAAKALDKLTDDDPDVQTGIRIVRRALEEPLRRIAENAGIDGAIVVGKIEEAKGAKGFNANTGEYEDLIAAGIIDPTKVVRSAVQNAASIAGLLLTTEAAITDAPEKRKRRRCRRGWRGLRLLSGTEPERQRPRLSLISLIFRSGSSALIDLLGSLRLTGRKFALKVSGFFAVALKRNGAYADDIKAPELPEGFQTV